MEKSLLMSVAIAWLAIPLVASRDRLARRGLKRAVAGLAAFMIVYAFLLRVVLPRLG